MQKFKPIEQIVSIVRLATAIRFPRTSWAPHIRSYTRPLSPNDNVESGSTTKPVAAPSFLTAGRLGGVTIEGIKKTIAFALASRSIARPVGRSEMPTSAAMPGKRLLHPSLFSTLNRPLSALSAASPNYIAGRILGSKVQSRASSSARSDAPGIRPKSFIPMFDDHGSRVGKSRSLAEGIPHLRRSSLSAPQDPGRLALAMTSIAPPTMRSVPGPEQIDDSAKVPGDNGRPRDVKAAKTGMLHLDGSALGRWAIEHLERNLRRPATGMTGVDPRLGAPRTHVAPF